MDEKTINDSKNPLVRIMNRKKGEEKTEEHIIVEQNTTQIKKEMIDDKKIWDEKIDHYAKNPTYPQKKPEAHKIIKKKEHLQKEIISNEQVINDPLKNPINQLNEEEKQEEHKILDTANEDNKETIVKQNNSEKIVKITKNENEEEEHKILELNNKCCAEPFNNDKLTKFSDNECEIIDNDRLSKLQENKNIEELIKKNILLSKYDPSKDFYPN